MGKVSKISPFVIKKVIDFTWFQNTRPGTLQVKTIGLYQAVRLMNMKTFHNFKVNVSKHNTLNLDTSRNFSPTVLQLNTPPNAQGTHSALTAVR